MQVTVFDLTTKKLRKMPKAHADILAKLKRVTFKLPEAKKPVGRPPKAKEVEATESKKEEIKAPAKEPKSSPKEKDKAEAKPTAGRGTKHTYETKVLVAENAE